MRRVVELTTIRAEVADDGVATLTLARPEAGNGISLELARDLNEITTEWSVDRRVRAVLVQGEGKNFCVGGDLKSFAARDDLPAHLTDVTTYLHAALSRLARLDAPVVAAVQGSAAGAGMSLAALADIVLVGASSRFVMAYTAIGLTPDGSSTWSIPRLVGLRRALELALTNRVLSAEEAVAEGIATRVVDDDRLAEEALAVARALAAGPTGALGAAKRLLRGSLAHDLETQMALETEAIASAAASADAKEGIAAFLAKRPPDFKGQDRW
jgi:2-(1,2-epoxy-1,2-dihydrophenyl)acetyl-CoA isomerase